MQLRIDLLHVLPERKIEKLVESQKNAKLEHGFFVPENFAILTSENETILLYINQKTNEVQTISTQKNSEKIVLESSLFMTCGIAGFEFHGYKFLAHASIPDFLFRLLKTATNHILQKVNLKEDDRIQVQITTDQKGELILKDSHSQTHQDYLQENVSNIIKVSHRYLDGRSTITSDPTLTLEYIEKEQTGLSWEEKIKAMQVEYALLAEQFSLVLPLNPDLIGTLWNLYLKKNNLHYKELDLDTFVLNFSSQMFAHFSAESFPDFMRSSPTS